MNGAFIADGSSYFLTYSAVYYVHFNTLNITYTTWAFCHKHIFHFSTMVTDERINDNETISREKNDGRQNNDCHSAQKNESKQSEKKTSVVQDLATNTLEILVTKNFEPLPDRKVVSDQKKSALKELAKNTVDILVMENFEPVPDRKTVRIKGKLGII